jgi:hypothetical protein
VKSVFLNLVMLAQLKSLPIRNILFGSVKSIDKNLGDFLFCQTYPTTPV